MRATLQRAAKTGTPSRSRDVDDGRRRAPRAAPRSGAHASRWADDQAATRVPQLPRPRLEHRARRSPPAGATRVGPLCLYGYDAHGNVAFLTDPAGNVTDTYTYDAWGNLIGGTGSTPNSRLYVGEEFDPDLGLLNLRARQYRPETGRFLTLDPAMGQRQRPITLNRYLYAGVDPIQFFDPTGTSDTAFYAIRAEQAQAAAVTLRVAVPVIATSLILVAISIGDLDWIINGIRKTVKGAEDKAGRLEWCLQAARKFLKDYFKDVAEEDITFDQLIEATEQAEQMVRQCLAR